MPYVVVVSWIICMQPWPLLTPCLAVYYTVKGGEGVAVLSNYERQSLEEVRLVARKMSRKRNGT
jgi:hypothetical protein